MGVTKLDHDRQTFQPAGCTFDHFLVAYEHKLSTLQACKRYLATVDKDFLLRPVPYLGRNLTFGTQPRVSYVGKNAGANEAGCQPIVLPYAGDLFTYKLPLGW